MVNVSKKVLIVFLLISVLTAYSFTGTNEIYAATVTAKPATVRPVSGGTKDLWKYLKLSTYPVDHLEKHTKDKYYRTTPFKTGTTPNGRDGKGGRMNCVGFILATLNNCGAKMPKYGKVPSGSRFFNGLIKSGVKYRRFSSISAAKSSGYLRKGDLLWYGPKVYKYYPDNTVKLTVPPKVADNHWAIYWGNGKQWDSWPGGNTIYPKMRGGTKKVYVFVFHSAPERGWLKINVKSSDNNSKTSGGYTLKGIKFKVYKSDKKTRVATLTTDKSGKTGKLRLKAETYYYKETSTLETGYKLDRSWHEIKIKGDKIKVDKITNDPYYASLKIETSIEGGNYQLNGFTFTIKNTENKKTYTAATNQNGVASFGKVLAGTYEISETLTDKQIGDGIKTETENGKVILKAKGSKTIEFKNRYTARAAK